MSLQVLQSDPEGGWKMVTIDENKPRGLAPAFCQRILKMAWFHIMILMLVLANAIVTATIRFEHNGRSDPSQKIDAYYYTEVGIFLVNILCRDASFHILILLQSLPL